MSFPTSFSIFPLFSVSSALLTTDLGNDFPDLNRFNSDSNTSSEVWSPKEQKKRERRIKRTGKRKIRISVEVLNHNLHWNALLNNEE